MSKLTSVEWLLKELYTEMNLSGDGRVLDEILQEAKEMHKQEIREAKENTYTEEQMKLAFEYGKSLEPFDSFEDFIQSLKQHK